MASCKVEIVLGPLGWPLLDGQLFPGCHLATIEMHDVEIIKPGSQENVIYTLTPRQVADGIVGGKFKVDRPDLVPAPTPDIPKPGRERPAKKKAVKKPTAQKPTAQKAAPQKPEAPPVEVVDE